MVEKQIELRRRRQRKAKMKKLKARLAAAKDGAKKEAITLKMRKLAPWLVPAKV